MTYPDRTALGEELSRESWKQTINWFLTTDPPSPDQRRQIEAQIDQIISTTTEFILEMFPESEAQIEEMAINFRVSLMELYNDALTPTLKRSLSPGEMEVMSTRLKETQHELEGHPFNDSHLEGKQKLFTEVAIGRLFVSGTRFPANSYRLPMTERMIELSNAVHDEFHQRAQARAERLFRESEAWSERMEEEALKALEAYDKAQLYGVDLHESAAPIEAGYNTESSADIRNSSDGTLFPVGDRQPSVNPGDVNVDYDSPPAPPSAGMRPPMNERRNLNPLEEDVTDFTDRQFKLLMERLQSLPAEASEKAFESDEAFEKEIRERQSREFRQPPPAEPQEENRPEEETGD